MSMLTIDTLPEIESLKWQGGLIPHRRYSVVGLRDTILTLAMGRWHPRAVVDLSSYAERLDCIVVIALDSVNYDLFSTWACNLSLSGLMPLASVFPTTSAAAWISIHSGLPPAQHGVYGVTFYSKEFHSVYSTYHRLRDLKAQYHPIPDGVPFRLFHHDAPTLAQSLTMNGWRCVTLRAAPIAPASPAVIFQEKGAEIMHIAPLGIRDTPELLIEHLTEEASRVLGDHARQEHRKLFLWLLADFDAYIHNTLDFVGGLESAWKRLVTWLDQNIVINRALRTAILFVADHGQVPQMASRILAGQFEEIVQDPKLCYAHRAGGGRTVFIYPHPERQERVRQLLQDLFGQNALVIKKAEAMSLGLFGSEQLLLEDRIGELIVIGQTPAFPAHSLQAFHEHGALSREELVVPFAWRLPRSEIQSALVEERPRFVQ